MYIRHKYNWEGEGTTFNSSATGANDMAGLFYFMDFLLYLGFF